MNERTIRVLLPLILAVVWIVILMLFGGKMTADPEPLVTIETGASVSALDWSPDGSKLVSAGPDIRIWDGGDPVLVLQGQANSVDWSPDGTRIASAGGESFIVWDASTGDLIYQQDTGQVLNAIAWSPDSTKLATSSEDSIITIWDASTGKQAGEIPYGRHAVIWSPDGLKISATPGVGSQPALYDVNTATEILAFQNESYLRAAAWSPDGRQVAYGGNDTDIYLFDATTGELLRTYGDHTSTVISISWNGTKIASVDASGDNRVQIWDSGTGETESVMKAAEGFTAAAWNPDGSKIAVSRNDGVIQIWDASRLP